MYVLCLCFSFVLIAFFFQRNEILESRALRQFYERKLRNDASSSRSFEHTKKSLRVILRDVAMEQHKLALQCGRFHVDQWKGHSTT